MTCARAVRVKSDGIALCDKPTALPKKLYESSASHFNFQIRMRGPGRFMLVMWRSGA